MRKLKAFAIRGTWLVSVLLLALPALARAESYECTVLNYVGDDAKIVGTMMVDASRAEAQRLVLDAEKDFCACQGYDGDRGEMLTCVFSPADSDVKIVRSRKGLPIAIKRNRFTSQISATSLAMASTTAEVFSMALPNAGGDQLYALYCFRAAHAGARPGLLPRR